MAAEGATDSPSSTRRGWSGVSLWLVPALSIVAVTIAGSVADGRYAATVIALLLASGVAVALAETPLGSHRRGLAGAAGVLVGLLAMGILSSQRNSVFAESGDEPRTTGDAAPVDWRGRVVTAAMLAEAGDLRGARLQGADLTDLDLRGEDLRGADLSGAVLIGVNLYKVPLNGARLEGSTLTNACLQFADLSGATLAGATADGAHTRDAVVADAAVQTALAWPVSADNPSACR